MYGCHTQYEVLFAVHACGVTHCYILSYVRGKRPLVRPPRTLRRRSAQYSARIPQCYAPRGFTTRLIACKQACRYLLWPAPIHVYACRLYCEAEAVAVGPA